MTERFERRLADLVARQRNGEYMRCPRCGADTMKDPTEMNAQSRIADLYICSACGTSEALLAFMHQEYPLTCWAAFQPERPQSDFRDMPAVDVLTEVIDEQVDTLIDIYKLCRDNPEDAEEYRLEAFEDCPGLTELWTRPFQARYRAADGYVVMLAKDGKDGIELTGYITEK